ncbi:MAG TPA: lysylphosphatidylglycerol synthase transmembrane domain-containing protein [Candidatus Acidoferrum sp.]|nr:lysylphosphatidylglycerol synthase transmembrane domain-containing protein [Candidatus Acidoferrum sp.]
MRTEKKKVVAGAAALVVLGYVLYRLRGALDLGDFSGGKLWIAVRSANPLYILLGVALIYLCFALRALRWQVFQKNLGKAEFWSTYRMTLAGFAALFVLGRAGEPVRPLLLSRKSKIPVADVFGIWVLERLFDFGCMGVIASAALFNLKVPGNSADTGSIVAHARMGGVLLAGGVAASFAFLVYLRIHGTAHLETRLKTWRVATGFKPKAAKIIFSVVRGIQTVQSFSDLLQAIAYSAVHWLLVLVVYYCVSQSFGGGMAALGWGKCTVLLAITLIGSVFQLPTVGGGAQAAAISVYTGIFGIEKEVATAAALVLWLVTFASCCIAGIPLLIHEGFSFGQLRKMAEREKEELAEEAARGVVKQSREGDADH